MSPAAGVSVTSTLAKRKTSPSPSTVFMPVVSLRGPHDAYAVVGSLAEYVAKFGARDTGSLAYDALDAAFLEGAPRAYCVRIVGPSAVKASKTLLNAGATTALTVTAKEYGSYWNATTVAVAASGTYVMTITEPDGTVRTSPTLTTLADAVAWGLTLDNFTIASTGSTIPVTVSATALTSGTDDRASITETERATARALLERKLGPGTHLEPGVSATASIQAIAVYCQAKNRISIVDLADTLDVANSVSAEAGVANTAGGWRVKLNRSWANIAGIAAGVQRLVPWSAIEAGKLGANDSAGAPAGQPAAGPTYGVSKTALSLSRQYNGTDRATLNDAHVNISIVDTDSGAIMGYGNRSLSTTPGEILFSAARTRMIIEAEVEREGRMWVHRLLGGDLHELAAFKGQLIAVCRRHRIAGSLLGATDDDAFRVLVDEVNTPENLLAGQLNSEIKILPAGASEFVSINITSYASAIGA